MTLGFYSRIDEFVARANAVVVVLVNVSSQGLPVPCPVHVTG